ncbi:MAG: hypothetical protein ABI091_26140 [Ferruginibacter sp.]
MNTTSSKLNELFDQIPRRHSTDNVKAFYNIIDEYETLLMAIEGENNFYEKHTAPFFEALDPIRANINKSSDSKASKKTKDSLFDEASGDLKDTMQELITMYADGNAAGGK